MPHGICPAWSKPFTKHDKPPKNHASANCALNKLIKSIRKGQDDDCYLVLDADLWFQLERITCSPFGAVTKGDVGLSMDARMIHDLSHPAGEPVNDHTIGNLDVEVGYDGARAVAARILDVARRHPGKQRMSTGDANGAFCSIPIHAVYVGRFASRIPELTLSMKQTQIEKA